MLTIIVFTVLIYFISIVLHEVAHGLAAYALGDPTAKNEGRLTLNPIAHIDPFGTILLPILAIVLRSPILFGWAKPVPYNPMYFKNVRLGTFLVAIAGVGMNLLIAIFFGLIVRFGIPPWGDNQLAANFLQIAGIIVWANLVLGIFNLIPIPPLDGSKVLFSLLSIEIGPVYFFLERFGIFILLFLLLQFPGVIGGLVNNSFIFITGHSFF